MGRSLVEAYLFNGYPSDEVLLRAFPDKKKPLDWSVNYFIVFNSENDFAWIVEYGAMSSACGRICNFPDFAKDWVIPEEGLKIYFAGSSYKSCENKPYDLFGDGGDEDYWPFFNFNLVLTHLKRR